MVYIKSIAVAALLSESVAATQEKSQLRSSSTSRRLDYPSFFSYFPRSSVTDHAAIGLDQAALESQLSAGTTESFQIAKDIYENGGNSKSYALVTLLQELDATIEAGEAIEGPGTMNNTIAAKAYETLSAGSKQIKVQYKTSDVLDAHVDCRVGGLPADEHQLDGCFKNAGIMRLSDGTELPYEYVQKEGNYNGRTLKGFSEQAQSKMGTCPTCPYNDYHKFYKYYGEFDYGDQWIQAAFGKTKTEFKNGNADFSKYDFVGRQEAIKKGTAYMNNWMYVIREFEDALDDCQKECLDCNSGSVHAWDEGVAFYYGTPGDNLVHKLADKRCQNFKTCGINGNEEDGTSKVNYDLYKLFASGQQNILSGNCPAARKDKEAIVPLMTVPLVQGTLRYAYMRGEQQDGEKEQAEGATFAAAILPFVYDCNKEDAEIIYKNMAVGSDAPIFADVKEAFQRNYECMMINGADVGGYFDAGSGSYYTMAEPFNGGYGAESGSGKNKLAMGLGIALGVIAVLALAVIMFMRNREKAGHPVFAPATKGIESAETA